MPHQAIHSSRLPLKLASSPLPLPLEQLGFTPSVIGRSHAEVIPQRVGRWWLEVSVNESLLPPRARQRLDAFRDLGVPIKAVVLFHEIPTATHSSQGSAVHRIGRFSTWLSSEVPVRSAQIADWLAVMAPVAGSAARIAASLTSKVLMAGGMAIVTVSLAMLAAALTDPCLVVVTESGYWIEIDRWVS